MASDQDYKTGTAAITGDVAAMIKSFNLPGFMLEKYQPQITQFEQKAAKDVIDAVDASRANQGAQS